MIAGIGGLEGLKKEAHLTFVRQLARRLTHALDGIAGSRALTAAERAIQEVCRDRFMLYDPTCDKQVRFVVELSELAAESGPTPSERSEGPTREDQPGEDHLLAALLQHDIEPFVPRPTERRARNDQHPLRRPEPCIRRREDWSDYLGKWRGGAA